MQKNNYQIGCNIRKLQQKTLMILFILSLLPNCLLAQAINNNEKEVIEKIVSYIEREMTQSKIPGLALAIVHDDHVVHLQGFGKANKATEVLPETPFILGSVTKSFTAMAILQLVDQGKIDLNHPVQSYLPWFQLADERSAARITIRDLLNQVSGLSTASGRTEFADDDSSDNALERGVRDLANVKLIAPVGRRYIYSNLNYDILGVVIQAVSNLSYEEYIEKNILSPLNMIHSYTDIKSARENGLAVGHNYAWGYPYATPNTPYPRVYVSAGNLISSSSDLANYMIAQLNNGHYLNQKMLSDSSMEIYHTVQDFDYAMGWHVNTYNGTKVIQHSGSTPNYRSNIMLIPGEKWGVALLINGQDMVFDGAARLLPSNVTRLMLGGRVVVESSHPFAYAFYLIAIFLLIQLTCIFKTFLRIKEWEKNKLQFTQQVYLRHIIIPFIANLVIAVSFLFLLPMVNQINISGALLFTPDVAWLALISASVAIIWGVFRTAVFMYLLKKERGPLV